MDPIRIFTDGDLRRTFRRLAHQILEPHDHLDDVVLVGMQPRGVYVTKAINACIAEDFGQALPFGVLDTTLYRDDFRTRLKMPEVHITDIPFDLYDKHVVIVDDVLFTGRTLRSAMGALMDFGRPGSIRCCCLIDRGHRELPVTADYIGKTIPTHANEEIQLRISDEGDTMEVYLVTNEETHG